MATRIAEETVAADEAQAVQEFITFLKEASSRRAEQTHGPIRRFNQTRAAGCVDAEFVVPADLPAALRVGLFAGPASYRARIRFASATSTSDSDADIRGMSVKVMGVPGENLTAGVTDQDFVLNSQPVMMASNTRGFLEFLRAVEEPGFETGAYFVRHPKVALLVAKARKHHSCHLDLQYWSATPYLFGEGRAVKYSAWPTSGHHSPDPPHRPSAGYLTDALIARLAEGEATFELRVQLQTDPVTMPIEDAMEEWSERDSPYQRVATIRIPSQTFSDAEQSQACEAMRFDPWHALSEHRPLGGMNRARRAIYQAMADFRLGAGR
jgi:hypothetical protein